MKAKELIKVLEAVDPECEVGLQIGGYGNDGEEYRDMCAKVQIESGECLDYLRIDYAIIHDDEATWVNLVLRQNNYNDSGMPNIAKRFDAKYNIKED